MQRKIKNTTINESEVIEIDESKLTAEQIHVTDNLIQGDYLALEMHDPFHPDMLKN